MNPWSIHAALFAKHAQHVVLIHFPIALFLVGVALDAAASWTGREAPAECASINFAIAAVCSLPAVVTGIAAWQWELEGRRPRGILLLHLVMGCISLFLMVITWWIHWNARRPQAGGLPRFRWVFQSLGVLAVVLTGHLGGFLSGVNALY